MRNLMSMSVLVMVLVAGGCVSAGGSSSSTSFDAGGGVEPAKAAARTVLEDHGVVLDEQVNQMMSMFSLGGAGPVQMLRGTSPGGSEVTASISQAGTAGEVTVSILTENPASPVLEAAIAADLRAVLGVAEPSAATGSRL